MKLQTGFSIQIRVLSGILAVIWMCVIFSYSADDAETSTQISRDTGYGIVQVINDVFHLGWDDARLYSESLHIEKLVRKCAHMIEYAVLFILVAIAIDVWRYGAGFAAAVLICFVYSCTDEFHQTFIEGRYGGIEDVGIDMCGVLIAAVISTLIVLIHTRRMQRMRHHSESR